MANELMGDSPHHATHADELGSRASAATATISATVLGDLVGWLALTFPSIALRNSWYWSEERLSRTLEIVEVQCTTPGKTLHVFAEDSIGRAIREQLDRAGGDEARQARLAQVEQTATILRSLGSQAPVFTLLALETAGDRSDMKRAVELERLQQQSPDGATAINNALARVGLRDAAVQLRAAATPYVWVVAENVGRRLLKQQAREPVSAAVEEAEHADPELLETNTGRRATPTLDESISPRDGATREPPDSRTGHDAALLDWLALSHPESHWYVLQLAKGLSRDQIVAARAGRTGQTAELARQSIEQLVSRNLIPRVQLFERVWLSAKEAEAELLLALHTGQPIGLEPLGALHAAALVGIRWAHELLAGLLPTEIPLDAAVPQTMREWVLLTVYETPCEALPSAASYAPAAALANRMATRALADSNAHGDSTVLDLHERLGNLDASLGLPKVTVRKARDGWREALRRPLARPTGERSDLAHVLVLPHYRHDHLRNLTRRARAWHPRADPFVFMTEAHLVQPEERDRDDKRRPVPTPVRLLHPRLQAWVEQQRGAGTLGRCAVLLGRVARTAKYEPVPVSAWLAWDRYLASSDVSSRGWSGVFTNEGLLRTMALLPAASGGEHA